ncbi:hypothetical protein QM012_000072 [Aureobasidium pullulans]|uniref:Protein kinase domain-containing protein n=1 Tax=Aureobasidium pullulans TaxID=5580 RepID=A0ABR0TVC3_AURPU
MNVSSVSVSSAPSASHQSARVKIIQLSGPIKIIVPFEDCSNNVKHDGLKNTTDAPDHSASVCANGKTMNEQSNTSLVDKNYGGHCDDNTHKTLASDSEVVNPDFPISKDDTEVKKFDCNNPDDTVSPFCPYRPGNEILLKTSEEGTAIKAIIVKCFPATLSCCMVIRFVEPAIFNNTSQCVLKLYDRRFSTQHRNDWEASPWNPELEKNYRDFVNCGDAEEFFSYWDAEKDRNRNWSAAHVDNLDRWSVAKRETYLQWDSTHIYETEKKAYEHMTKLQGEDVPRLFGEVILDQPAPQDHTDADEAGDDEAESDDDDGDIDPHIVNIPGILIEYIDGFHLTNLHENLSQDCWQTIVDTAIEKLHHIQECGILNRDVNIRSFMVNPLNHKVVMIDFGIVLFREDCENDKEWERLQAYQDEEGAVGLVMQSYLANSGADKTTYKPSEYFWRLKYRYRGMEGEREGGTEEEEEFVQAHKDFVFR